MFILDNEIFTVDTLIFQNQLSAVEEESNTIAGSEVEVLRETIVDKDRKIAELSGELQTLQAQLQTVDKYPSEEEEEEEEEVYGLMVETSDLRVKLVEAEDEKQERKRQLEVIHRQREHLKQLIADLRDKKCAASQVDCCDIECRARKSSFPHLLIQQLLFCAKSKLEVVLIIFLLSYTL